MDYWIITFYLATNYVGKYTFYMNSLYVRLLETTFLYVDRNLRFFTIVNVDNKLLLCKVIIISIIGGLQYGLCC